MANRPALASNGRTILTSDHHHRPTEHSFPVSLYKNEACPPWTCLILVFIASKNRRDEIFKTSKRIENFVGSVFPNPFRAFLFSPPCLPEPSRTTQEYLLSKNIFNVCLARRKHAGLPPLSPHSRQADHVPKEPDRASVRNGAPVL